MDVASRSSGGLLDGTRTAGSGARPVLDERAPAPDFALQLAQKYLESIKGVGVYRANSGPFDKPVWAKPATEDK